ncbi:AmmeMemoRadiSam system radical SAM enzyme [Archaeoglobales archaeon]|nr:MAG: AmmeMemoRadiSam system radical SAM enzyme [Archaeoglobales archaeon]
MNVNTKLQEAKLYSRINNKVVCRLCWHKCRIEDDKTGFCGARVNFGGKLYTLTYANLSAIDSRPIEIKPFYHFKPASSSLTFSTYSCNLTCPWCQNWHLSKTMKEGYIIQPEKLIQIALNNKDLSLCASFNEPTLLFEYLLDSFRLAKEHGLLNTMVSNGFMSLKALEMLKNAGLDAMNIDIKGNDEVYEKYCGGKAKYVWKVVNKAIKLKLHVEVINLIITDVNDSSDVIEEIIENHLKYAGCSVPLHFTRYFPAFLFNKPPTKIEILEKAIDMAKKEGVEYVYIGNVRSKFENTYCPRCRELLIRRHGYEVIDNKIKKGKCFNCGKEIYGVW